VHLFITIYLPEKSVFLYNFLGNKYNKGECMVTSSLSVLQKRNPQSKAVKLSAKIKNGYQSVIFNVTPEMNEQRSVSYAEISDLRLPASILIYMGSPSRHFSISAKLLSRTTAEADVSFQYMNLLKGWCVTATEPYIGTSKAGLNGINTDFTSITKIQNQQSAVAQAAAVDQNTLPTTPPNSVVPKPDITSQKIVNTDSGTNLFYQTPQVLFLTGYGQQYRNIPVVIRDLNISFPSEVDYIKTSKGAWVPILQDVGIGLQEARNVYGRTGTSIDSFDLTKFKAGQLPYW